MSPSLANQVIRRWAGAEPDEVPGRMLLLWPNTDLPSGEGEVRVLTQREWSACYWLLENAALEPDVVPPPSSFETHTRDMRPDAAVPISIANFRVAVPSERVVQAVKAAAERGRDLRFAEADLEHRRVFLATGFLHAQFMREEPAHRGRNVRLVLDRALYRTTADEPAPDGVQASPDGGATWQGVEFGKPFGPFRAEGDRLVVQIRCRYGDDVRTAAFAVAVSDAPAPPEPAETWLLKAADSAATGRATVFPAGDGSELRNPLIVVEGFPGNRGYDYTYEVLDQHGMVDALQRNGYDLIIVGLDRGAIPIEQNVGVLLDCIDRARKRTSRPLVVGGCSMGGIISRIALAQLEKEGTPHGTRAYLSIDAPHGGTYTSLGVQWYVRSLLPVARGLQEFANLLDSPANQQLLLWWLGEDGEAIESGLRTKFKDDLQKLGYPRQPRKLAVASGTGGGIEEPKGGIQVLGWDGGAVAMTVRTLPGEDGTVADGSWFGTKLKTLRAPDGAPPWEAAPGGRNPYNALMGVFTKNLGCGRVKFEAEPTCGVPTVSALDLDADDRFKAVPLNATEPFDAYTFSADGDREHMELTEEATRWIVEELGLPPAPGSRAFARSAGAWNPYSFDPYDPKFLRDPYETYARFREHDPHFFVTRFHSRWFFGYDACREILDDQVRFVKNRPGGSDPTPGPVGILREFPESLFESDPPRHGILRSAFEPAFHRAIVGAAANARQRADAILEPVKESRHIELVHDYAVPVPANVVLDVLGVPDLKPVRDGILALATSMIAAHDTRQPLSVRAQGATSEMALQTYLDGLILQCTRKAPKGLIGEMANATGGLPPEDLYTSGIEFVVAGYLSTTWLVASAITTLTAHKQLRPLLTDRANVASAMTEVLRLEPPVQIIDRYAAEDTTIGEVRVAKGDKVTAVIASANRDDSRFADPDGFRLDRENACEHLSFGAGIHRCIGAPLAKQVAPVMLCKLLDLGEPSIEGLPQWQTDPYLRGLVNLPLRFR